MSESHIKPVKEKSYDEGRFWPRFKCNLATELLEDPETVRNCKIVNISENGLGIKTDAQLQEGKRIQLVDPKVEADVVWIRNKRAGLVICD
ncbi:MAG TPA: PilZ domain-containing protein [Dissulfurispiraceae bacterium]|nr:PilZ domain-containing protein [Dissulfurispiraceae bacterium]